MSAIARRSSRALLAPLLGAALLAVPAAAPAQVRVGVMAARVQPVGAIPPAVAQAITGLLWQAVAGAPGTAAVPEHQVAAALGPAGGALAPCQSDACMAQLGAGAGLDRVLWALVLPSGSGFAIHARSLSVRPYSVLVTLSPSCAVCSPSSLPALLDAGVLARLVGMKPGGPPTAPPSVAPPRPLALPRPVAPAPPPPRPTPTTGRLVVHTTPAGATAVCQGRQLGVTPLDLAQVQPGTYTLGLYLAGHAPAEAEARITAGGTARVRKRLTALSTLELSARRDGKPVAAGVLFDGRPAGATPLTLPGLAPGRHEVVVEAAGLKPVRRKVVLRPGKREKVEIALALRAGRLTVRAQPKGTEVWLGDQVLGFVPLNGVELPVGLHRVVLRAEGHAESAQEVQILEDHTARIDVTLSQLPGSLEVRAEASREAVPGAAVVVDGEPAGQTPLTLPVEADGTHLVRVTTGDGWSGEARVEVTPGRRHEVTVELHPPIGQVHLTSKPSGATVVSDVGALGETPLKGVELPVGEHELVASKDGWFPETLGVTVRAGGEVRGEVELLRKPTDNTRVARGVAGPFVIGVTVARAKKHVKRRSWRWRVEEDGSQPVARVSDGKGRRMLQLGIMEGDRIEWIVVHDDRFVTADGLGAGVPLVRALALREERVVCGAHADRLEAYVRLDEAWAALQGPPSWMADLLELSDEAPSRALCKRFAGEGARLGALDIRPTDVQKEVLESLGR